MLQIRLSKGSAGDGGGETAAKPPPPPDMVTVACPDHLVIADLPVAKSVGAVTSSAAAAVKTVGRRSRRSLGERVHFCVRCDLPIAVYGRLVPCEHVFCLTCARSDASCYLCEERIQKIQSIKMMEGIFICAAPHCLKSFLKQFEFETHVHEAHSDLLQSNTKKEDGTEEARASSTDTHKQSSLQETSTGCAPPNSGFSTSANSQHQDRDERTHRHQSKDYPPSVVPLHLKPMPFHSPHQHQPGDMQSDNNLPQGFDKPNSWIYQPQGFMNQAGSQNGQVSNQLLPGKHAGNPLQSSFSDYTPLQPPLPPNYQLPVNTNQAIVPPAEFSYPLSADRSQQYYSVPYEIPRPESLPAGGPAQGSVLGFAPAPAGIASFAGTAPRPWVTGQMVVPFDPSFMLAQGSPQGYMNLTDFQGRIPSLQGDGGQLSGGWLLNQSQIGQESKLQGVSAVNSDDSKGVMAQLPQPVSLQMPLPLPPPLPLPMTHQFNAGNFSGFSTVNQEGQGYG